LSVIVLVQPLVQLSVGTSGFTQFVGSVKIAVAVPLFAPKQVASVFDISSLHCANALAEINQQITNAFK
jgi:hypothetical protein